MRLFKMYDMNVSNIQHDLIKIERSHSIYSRGVNSCTDFISLDVTELVDSVIVRCVRHPRSSDEDAYGVHGPHVTVITN